MHTGNLETEKDYKQAMAEIEKLFDLDPDLGTPEADRFEVLAVLVEAYETERIDNTPPTLLEAIEFRMEQEGLI